MKTAILTRESAFRLFGLTVIPCSAGLSRMAAYCACGLWSKPQTALGYVSAASEGPRLVLIALTGGINIGGPSVAHSLGYVIYCDLDYGCTIGPEIVAGGDSHQRRAVRAIYPEHIDANNSTSRISLSYSTDLGTRAGRSPLVCVVTKGNLLRFRPSGPRQRAPANSSTCHSGFTCLPKQWHQ